MTTQPDVTSTVVQKIEAEPERAAAVLERIDPMRPLADRLSALGVDDRAIWTESGRLTYRLIWRFGAGAGHARVDWQLAVGADGAGETVLTVKLAGSGSDESARVRVLRSWLLVEELARSHARRLARMLDDYTEEAASAPMPRLRVVGAVGY
jgi:hypothetical protein